MHINYIKTAWRNLRKNKLYSSLNIAGLAIGMTVSFLLLLYVHHEFTYDQFNVNSERIFLAFKNQAFNGQVKTKPFMPEPLAALLQKDFPEIELAARTTTPENSLISYRDKSIKLSTIAADSALTDIFTFQFIAGNKQTALTGQSSIVLTQSAAVAIFGNIDPLGQIVKLYNRVPLTVSAVIKDLPLNASLQCKAIIPWACLVAQQPWIKEVGFSNFAYPTYFMLKPAASPVMLNAKIKDIVGKYDPSNKEIKLFLFPLTKVHLYNEFVNGYSNGGRIEYVRLFFILALGILLIACINFMNLSTARSAKRAREVGVRKAVGASRFALIRQFMAESLLMSFLAFTLSLLLLILLLPAFNRMVDIQLALPYNNMIAWMLAAGITLGTGLIAGSYPAFFLSSFNPVKVLKGPVMNTSAAIRPRQLLVVVQFTFAVCLIVSSIFIYRQINFIKNRPAGYDRSGLIEMPVDGNMGASFESFRQEAIAAGAIADAAITSAPISENVASSWEVIWPNQLPGENKLPIDCMGATWHFTSTYGLQIIQGRDFDKARPADSNAVILNEAAVKLMRLPQPLGQQITWQDSKRKVVGVVKNFVWGSPYEPVKPAIIGFAKEWTGNIGLRLHPGKSVSASLLLLQNIYKKYNPGYGFEYKFTADNFSKKYNDEKLLGSISVSFTSLAIFISCLGLFGLASFSAEQKKKEIGIRKVLGADVLNLWYKLSGEFVKLILISFITGSAISWYCIYHWLNKYTFHTSFSIWVFAVTLLLSVAICLLAVSWQAIKAASANPVNSLRAE